MPATLKDIARRVGKSVPTVSRALGGFDDVSEETRRAVLEAAEELGYTPNIPARNLRQKSSRTIALLLPLRRDLRFSDPFFGEFLAGLAGEITAQGYDLNILVDHGEDETKHYHDYFRSRRVDGFILVRTERQDRRIDYLREEGIPSVAFGRVADDADFHYVDADDQSGIRAVFDWLVGLGHRRVGFIAEPLRYTKAYNRLQGYLQGLAAHNLPHLPELIVETNYRQLSGHLAAHHFFELPEPPTAVIASNDLLALGVISAALERGLVVGRDISVTGYDDIVLAQYTYPPLTSVRQPAEEIGQMVADLLMRQLNDDPIDQRQILLEPELIVRQSTGRVDRMNPAPPAASRRTKR